MDLWYVLLELVVIFGMAFALGTLAQKFRQSPILGYISAGVVAGPMIDNAEMISQMAELGVSLLLFSIGLEFSFRQLRRMGSTAFGGGALQVGLTIAVTALGGVFFSALPKSLALGALLALSSTTIVLRVLVDRAEMESVHGRTSLGILLFQDMAIVPLVIMISLLSPSTGTAGTGAHLLNLLAAVCGLAAVLYILLFHLIPRLLSSSAVFSNRELTVLFAVSTGLGATWAAHAAGISPALGAFVAGMLLGESPFATQVRADIGSLKILMVTLFFASVGMFIKPLWFISHIYLILPLAALVFVFKAGIIYAVTRLFGLDRRHALATGIMLGQIGEFSFVLAAAARDGGLIGTVLMDYIISVTILLMLATPYMVSMALPLSNHILSRLTGKKDGVEDQTSAPVPGGKDRVLVVGLGPAGRQVVKTIKTSGMMPVIIDVNPQGSRFAARQDALLFLGDAASEDILNHAGLSQACLAVITVPDAKICVQIIAAMKRLSPTLPIVARSRYNRHFNDLKKAGATVVVDEETLMGEMLSHQLTNCLADDNCTLLARRLTGKSVS